MALTIRERILQRVKNRLEFIQIANGFNVNICQVFRSQKEIIQVSDFPTLIMDDFGDDRTWNVKRLYEHRMRLSIQIAEHDYDGDDLPAKLNAVLGDIEKTIVLNEFWDDGGPEGDLAVATLMARNIPSIDEAQRPIGSDSVEKDIIYRVQDDDPTKLRTF